MKITLTPCEGVTLRCAICHDDAIDGAIVCAGCRTLCHPECRDGIGCPTLGCVQRTTRARLRLAPVPSARRSFLPSLALRFWSCLGVVVLLTVAHVNVAVMGHHGYSRGERVRADMRWIGDALDLFKIACGHYPQRLSDLWVRPDAVVRWKGPYLTEYPPRDPWGTDYVYVLTGAHRYEIISLGADGAPGGTDEAADLSSRTISSVEPQ